MGFLVSSEKQKWGLFFWMQNKHGERKKKKKKKKQKKGVDKQIP
jgi:hypothetical protein